MSNPCLSKSPVNVTMLVVFVALILSTGSLFSAFAQGKQLSLADILIALRSKKAEIQEKNKILSEAVKTRGITFALTPEIEKELASTGAHPDLLSVLRDKSPVVQGETPAQQKTEPLQIASIGSKPVPAPPNFEYYWNRATASLTKNDTESALIDLDHAIELRPGDAPSRLARGNVLVTQGKFEAAIADLDTSIKVNETSAAYFARGGANEKLRKTESAIADYKKASDLDAQNDAAKTALTRLVAEKTKAETKPPVEPAKPTVAVPVVTGPVNIGALNNFASRLVQPVYSELDRKMGFQGKVVVLITLDETGKVVSAEANSGPRTLRSAAVDAVKKSKFNPIVVDGNAVKAEGSITFNFVAK